MNLLLVEVDEASLLLLRELCRDSGHRLLCCRGAREAVESCRWHADRIDWIVINGSPGEASRDLEGWIRATGCRAPLVYLAAGEPLRRGVKTVGRSSEEGMAEAALAASRRSLTRLDLFHLLSRLGGDNAREEMLFEYHAPHPVLKSTGPGRKGRLPSEPENL